MKVERVMSTDPAAVSPETTVGAALRQMRARQCGFLPVVDDRGGVVGVMTDRDIALALGARDARPTELSAADVMTPEPRTCRVDETAAQALRTMRDARVRRLPVLAGTRLVGALSIDDLVPIAQNVRAGADRVSFEQVMETLVPLSLRCCNREAAS